MEGTESRKIALTLARHVVEGMDAAQVAATVDAIWKQVDASLRPIIGQRGVASLFLRSIHLTTPRHPWLSSVQGGDQGTTDFAALQTALAGRDSAEAAAAGGDLLQAFHELLASLVGASLTDQLLGSIWANSSRGDAAQDGPQ